MSACWDEVFGDDHQGMSISGSTTDREMTAALITTLPACSKLTVTRLPTPTGPDQPPIGLVGMADYGARNDERVVQTLPPLSA